MLWGCKIPCSSQQQIYHRLLQHQSSLGYPSSPLATYAFHLMLPLRLFPRKCAKFGWELVAQATIQHKHSPWAQTSANSSHPCRHIAQSHSQFFCAFQTFRVFDETCKSTDFKVITREPLKHIGSIGSPMKCSILQKIYARLCSHDCSLNKATANWLGFLDFFMMSFIQLRLCCTRITSDVFWSNQHLVAQPVHSWELSNCVPD